MRDLSRLTGAVLLSVEEPERLFSLSIDERQAEYRQLAKTWHPDICRQVNAKEVFAHIAALYDRAEKKRSNKTWDEPGEKVEDERPGRKVFKTVTGHLRQIDYLTSDKFELGEVYIGDHHVTYLLRREFDDLYKNACSTIQSFMFKDSKMQTEMMKYLPQINDTFVTPSASALVIGKTPDCLRLKDILEHMGGVITPPGHIGWTLNVAYNIVCYLQFAGLTHNDISLDSYYVNPLRHSGMLLGGWWYSARRHHSMVALPDRTLNNIPPDILRRKTSGFRTDLDLIRAMGRELLGDGTGASLPYKPGLPKPLVDYLRLSSSGNAKEDYKVYKNEVLEACWPKKYIELKIEAKDLYAGATK